MKKVGFSIKLNDKDGEDVISVLAKYKSIDKPLDVYSHKSLLHIYPTADTYDKDGKLNGYRDSLFFELHVYNVNTMTVYKTENKDGVNFDNIPIRGVRVFKDGSFIVMINEPFTLGISQCVSVWWAK